MNKIELVLDKQLTKLVGNTFGREVYDAQVKGKIDLSKRVCIVLPSAINRVASSFVQGFFDDIVRQIGVGGVEEKFDFEAASILDFKQFVLENLE